MRIKIEQRVDIKLFAKLKKTVAFVYDDKECSRFLGGFVVDEETLKSMIALVVLSRL